MSRTLITAAVAGAALLAVGCSSPASTATGSTPPSAAPSPTVSITTAPPAPTASTSVPTPKSAPEADAVVRPVPDSQWAAIVASGAWHRGCPATQRTLRRVEVGFHGFDGAVHRGVLVVNADVATEVARIFTRLFDRGFPIHRMAPIEVYHGDDNASMAADNTSAYNCRRARRPTPPRPRHRTPTAEPST